MLKVDNVEIQIAIGTIFLVKIFFFNSRITLNFFQMTTTEIVVENLDFIVLVEEEN